MFRDLTDRRLEKSINMQGRLDIRTVAFIAESLKKSGERIKYLADIQLACVSAAEQYFISVGKVNRFKTVEDAYYYLLQEELLNEENMGKNQARITGRAMSIESLHIAQKEAAGMNIYKGARLSSQQEEFREKMAAFTKELKKNPNMSEEEKEKLRYSYFGPLPIDAFKPESKPEEEFDAEKWAKDKAKEDKQLLSAVRTTPRSIEE